MNRVSTTAFAVAFLMLLSFRPAAAQACTTEDPRCPPNEAPQLMMSSPPLAVGQRNVTITLSAWDDVLINTSSVSFKQNGATQTLTFVGQIPPGQPINVTWNAAITLIGANETSILSLYACDTASPALCETIYDTLTYLSAPMSQTPVLSLDPQNVTRRFLGGCAECAPGQLSYSTPSYMSLDAPRASTLVYSTEQAKPVGFVQLEATVRWTEEPQYISVRLWDPGTSSYLTLSNDSTEVFFQGDTGVFRIAAQVKLDSMATGARTVTAYVKAKYAASALTATIPVRVLVQTENKSPYGIGWTVAGVERLHFVGDSLLVTNGAGMLEFFRKLSCTGSPESCTYTSPTGDFSTLAKHPPISGFDNATFTRTYPDGSTTVFLSTGLMRHKRDRFGNETKVTYTILGNNATVVSTIIDGAGKTTTFGYAGSGGTTPKPYTLTSITLPDGRVSTFSVSGTSGDLTAIDDPGSVDALNVTYTDHRPTAWVPRGKGTFNSTYDGFGQLATTLSPPVDSMGTGPRPTTTITSMRGRLLPGPGQGMSSASLASKSKLRPDSAHVMVAAQSGAKARSWGHRSGGPSRTETIDAAGKKLVDQLTYDAADRLERHVDSRNAVTTNTWSGGLLTSTLDGATGMYWQYVYGPFGQTSETKLNSVTMKKAFFTGGSALYPDSVRSDTAHVTKFTWDSRGRPLTVRSSATELRTIAYQSTGFLNTQSVTVAVTGESNKVTSFTYNSRGLLESTTDPLGRTSTLYRDVMNRDSVHIAPQNVTSLWFYNEAARTVTFRDALLNETKTKVNFAGWPIARTDPRLKVDRFVYDSVGNLITTVTRKGATISMTYDAQGRMLKRKSGTDSTLFAYDTAGRWVATSNAESVDTVFTDAEGRLSQAVTWRGTQRFTVTYGYSEDGSRYRREVAAGGGSSPATWGPYTAITGTDAARRLNYLNDFADKGTGITYTKQEQVAQVTLPTNTNPTAKVKRQFAYHNSSMLGSEVWVNATSLSRTYPSYDALGRLLAIQQAGSPATHHRLFTFDAQDRLASYADVDSTTYWYCENPEDELECEATGWWVYDETTIRSAAFTYDTLGNRTDLGGLKSTGNRQVRLNGDSLTYDDGGFLTRRWKLGGGPDRRYYWNAIGQLDSVRVIGGALTSYKYDGWGRRIRKTEAGVTTNFLLDGDHVITELTSTNAVGAHFTYYPGADQLHSMRRGGKTYYYAYDASGQITGLVDSVGAIVRTYVHTPHGAPVSETGSVVNHARFKGREWDAEAELYYNRARYFDLQIERFISEDPIGLAGGTNLYQYANGDPANRRDPTGLYCELVSDREEIEGGYRYSNFRWEGTTCTGNSGGIGGSFEWFWNQIDDIARGGDGSASKWVAPQEKIYEKTFAINYEDRFGIVHYFYARDALFRKVKDGPPQYNGQVAFYQIDFSRATVWTKPGRDDFSNPFSYEYTNFRVLSRMVEIGPGEYSGTLQQYGPLIEKVHWYGPGWFPGRP